MLPQEGVGKECVLVVSTTSKNKQPLFHLINVFLNEVKNLKTSRFNWNLRKARVLQVLHFVQKGNQGENHRPMLLPVIF